MKESTTWCWRWAGLVSRGKFGVPGVWCGRRGTPGSGGAAARWRAGSGGLRHSGHRPRGHRRHAGQAVCHTGGGSQLRPGGLEGGRGLPGQVWPPAAVQVSRLPCKTRGEVWVQRELAANGMWHWLNQSCSCSVSVRSQPKLTKILVT